MILLHTEIIFHGDIKPRSILQCRISCKITDFRSSFKIGDETFNAEKYNWGYYPPEVVATLLNSEQMNKFSGLPTYDLWYLGYITYHLILGSPHFNLIAYCMFLYTVSSISLKCLCFHF